MHTLRRPTKYELIHLTRHPKRFNLEATISFEATEVSPKAHVRVLGVEIDSKLWWGPHVRRIQSKMEHQTNALTRIATSTWGATFRKARLVYTAVVRPALAYGTPIWFSPEGKEATKPSLIRPLKVIQNRCLRTIAGAYKATPILLLESETGILPVRTHFSKLQAQYQLRKQNSPVVRLITSACERIQRQLQGSRGRTRRHPTTPGVQKLAWYQKLLRTNPQSRAATPQSQIDKATHNQWTSNWVRQRNKVPPDKRVAAHVRDTTLKDPHLHDNLYKAESSLATQLRTEKIGFNAFLARQRVPNVTSDCTCGYPDQTVKHVMLFCPDIDRSNENLGPSSDLNSILTNAASLRKAVRWLMGLNILPQFHLARELLWDNIGSL